MNRISGIIGLFSSFEYIFTQNGKSIDSVFFSCSTIQACHENDSQFVSRHKKLWNVIRNHHSPHGPTHEWSKTGKGKIDRINEKNANTLSPGFTTNTAAIVCYFHHAYNTAARYGLLRKLLPSWLFSYTPLRRRIFHSLVHYLCCNWSYLCRLCRSIFIFYFFKSFFSSTEYFVLSQSIVMKSRDFIAYIYTVTLILSWSCLHTS